MITHYQLIDKQVANHVTCHKKFPDHIPSSMTFLGLQNSLTIPGFTGLWEPWLYRSTCVGWHSQL